MLQQGDTLFFRHAENSCSFCFAPAYHQGLRYDEAGWCPEAPKHPNPGEIPGGLGSPPIVVAICAIKTIPPKDVCPFAFSRFGRNQTYFSAISVNTFLNKSFTLGNWRTTPSSRQGVLRTRAALLSCRSCFAFPGRLLRSSPRRSAMSPGFSNAWMRLGLPRTFECSKKSALLVHVCCLMWFLYRGNEVG